MVAFVSMNADRAGEDGLAPVRDVLVAELGSCLQGLVSVAQLVVSLISLTETQQNLVGLVHARLWHVHWLESSAYDREKKSEPVRE